MLPPTQSLGSIEYRRKKGNVPVSNASIPEICRGDFRNIWNRCCGCHLNNREAFEAIDVALGQFNRSRSEESLNRLLEIVSTHLDQTGVFESTEPFRWVNTQINLIREDFDILHNQKSLVEVLNDTPGELTDEEIEKGKKQLKKYMLESSLFNRYLRQQKRGDDFGTEDIIVDKRIVELINLLKFTEVVEGDVWRGSDILPGGVFLRELSAVPGPDDEPYTEMGFLSATSERSHLDQRSDRYKLKIRSSTGRAIHTQFTPQELEHLSRVEFGGDDTLSVESEVIFLPGTKFRYLGREGEAYVYEEVVE